MNTQYRSFYAIVALLATLIFNFTVCLTAAAAPSSAFYHRFEPPTLPPVITLFDNTPLYPEPDESIEPWATLSPQDVNTIEAEKEWFVHTDGKPEKRWIKIKTTWLGDLWIHLDIDKIGTLKPMDSYIALLWPAALYTQPVKSALTDVVLDSQTVHANAVFESPVTNRSYRIETSWLGDQWLVDPPRILVNMTVLNQEMDLPTETLYMDEYDTANRMQRPSDAKFIPAQKVFALEKTENNEYHVRSADGSTFWINPLYAQPVGAKESSEIIELTKDTALLLFPATSYPRFGLLSAQKVQAFVQWDDPQGHRWYRIHSWCGDMWIQPNSM
jgi:hypothetical protein